MTSVFSWQNCQPLPCFILYSKAKLACYSRYLLTSVCCIPIPYDKKDIFFWCQFQNYLIELNVFSDHKLYTPDSNQQSRSQNSICVELPRWESALRHRRCHQPSSPACRHWLAEEGAASAFHASQRFPMQQPVILASKWARRRPGSVVLPFAALLHFLCRERAREAIRFPLSPQHLTSELAEATA